jgi:hypothetical protein
MNQLKAPQAFVRRFDAVRSRMLQVQVARAVLRSVLLVLAGLALLAGIDYLWEVPRLAREIGLVGLLGSAFFLTAWWIIAAFRFSNRPRTAFEIEEHFPELGQSVRTAVQFGGKSDEAVAADGVRSTLVCALEERIDVETTPLPIEAVIPTGRLKIATAVVIAACLVLGVLFVGSSEWNTAGRRTLLEEQPYTKLSVTPGNTQVELGKDLPIGIELSGRTSRQVTLLTRSADDPAADWQEQKISEEDLASSEAGLVRYEVVLPKIKDSFVYRVAAGKIASDEFQVGIRYPLHLEKVEVVMTPPEYTRAEPSTSADGNISALEGTHAVFRFELDRPAATASVILADPRDVIGANKNRDDEQAPIAMPVKIDGTVLTMEMDIAQDKVYALVAESADGMKLPENSFRIRVRKDQPPQVFFDEPREALEVHTLAELMMRIHVRDDFGLLTAGIVFQVNNEEEHTLLKRDFEAELAEAAKEAGEGKLPPPTMQQVLDRLLPLEHFDLKEQDSVTYYAFAEDNYPGGPHRAETDLRFVDIRPFRRTFKLLDPPDGGMGTPMRLPAFLPELIARQRFALNQALRLARRPESSQSDLGTVDRVIEFEQKLAAATRESAEFFEARQVAGNDLLFQAEDKMLAAVDSLSAGKYETAVLQEKDALRFLIEGRRTIEQALSKKPAKIQAEARNFDRRMTQKLRKPKNEEDAEEVAERLRELASAEEFVYETLTGLKMDDPQPGSGGDGGSGKPKEKPDQPQDPKEAQGSSGDQPKTNKGSDDPKKDEAQSAKGEKPDGKSGDDDKEKNKPGAGKDSAKEGDGGADGSDDDKKPSGPTREELVQKQADIAVEAADIKQLMEKMNGLSDLAKARIGEALKTAEQGAGALERGDTKEAAKATEKATGMFRELARNVEALAAGETAQRIAMARNIAEELSQTERDLAAELQRQDEPGAGSDEQPKKSNKPGAGQRNKPSEDKEKPKGGGSGDKPNEDKEKPKAKGSGDKQSDDKQPGGAGSGDKEDEEKNDSENGGGGARRTEKLANRADRIAEAGKTLEDVLKAIAQSNDPADKEAARQVQELMEQGKLGETVKRLEAQAPAVRAGKAREAGDEARDMADRFEVTAQKLETLHRGIVAPRIAELMELEREASDLQEKLEKLETPAQITKWHQGADELLEQLEKIGIAEEPREELYEAMKEAGWTVDRSGRWNWALVNRYYGAPVVYHRTVKTIVADLHAVIQELILGDLRDMGDETTPPQYERLVERYYQILSTDK